MHQSASLRGLFCSPGNFSPPLLGSIWRIAISVGWLAHHCALAWNLGQRVLQGIHTTGGGSSLVSARIETSQKTYINPSIAHQSFCR
jgi:hypothetical protein